MTDIDTAALDESQQPFKRPIQQIIDGLVDALYMSEGHKKRLEKLFEEFAREIKRASIEGEW